MGDPERPSDRPIGDVAKDVVAGDAATTTGDRPGKVAGVAVGGRTISTVGAIGGVAVVGVLLLGAAVLHLGPFSPANPSPSVAAATTQPSPPPAASAAQPPAATTPPASATTPPLSGGGTYIMKWTILSDPAGHDPFTGYSKIPTITVAVNGNSNTITGPSPWVLVTGQYNSSTGAFTDTGTGTVAGFNNVPVSVTGTISGNSITFSQLQLGPTNLPTNRAEVLSGTGTKQ